MERKTPSSRAVKRQRNQRGVTHSRHHERWSVSGISVVIQDKQLFYRERDKKPGLPRRYAPRNDGGGGLPRPFRARNDASFSMQQRLKKKRT